MVPQLVISIDNGVAEAMDDAFGKGAFAGWLNRVREVVPQAWSSEEDPPPLFIVTADQGDDGTDEKLLRREPAFDEHGVVRGGQYAVQVTPVEGWDEGIRVQLASWVTGAPSPEEPS